MTWLLALYVYFMVGYAYNFVLIAEYCNRIHLYGRPKPKYAFIRGFIGGFFGGWVAPLIGLYRIIRWGVHKCTG